VEATGSATVEEKTDSSDFSRPAWIPEKHGRTFVHLVVIFDAEQRLLGNSRLFENQFVWGVAPTKRSVLCVKRSDVETRREA